MKTTTEDARKYAAEHAISKEGVLKKGMEKKAKEFVKRAWRFTR